MLSLGLLRSRLCWGSGGFSVFEQQNAFLTAIAYTRTAMNFPLAPLPLSGAPRHLPIRYPLT